MTLALTLTLGLAATAPLARAATPVAGSQVFDVEGATVGQDLYQVAYSARNDVLWVTGTSHVWNDDGEPRAATSTVTKVNPRTLKVLQTIKPRTLDAGTPNARSEAAYGIAADDEHNRVWTTSTREESAVIYDQGTGAHVRTIPGVGRARDIAIDPYRDAAYLSDPNGGQITKISTKTLEVIDRIKLGGGFSPMSLELIADETSGKLYTVNLNDGALIEFDLVTKSARTVAQTGGISASGVAVDPTRGLAYISSQKSADVRTVNLATGKVTKVTSVIDTIKNGAPGVLNSAVDPKAGLVYSTVFQGSSVFVTDATTGEPVGEVQVGSAPNHVIIAGGSAWAVDRAPGGSSLSRITPKTTTPDPDPFPVPDPSQPPKPGGVKPAISGNAVVNEVLYVTRGTWLNAPGAYFEYQWVRNGKPIKGATSREYRLTAQDAGQKLFVWVQASTAAGSGEALSDEITVAKAAKADTRVSTKVIAPQGRQQARIVAEIGSKDWIKPSGRLTITASGKTVSVPVSDYYVEAELPWLRPGLTHQVTVHYSGNDTLDGSSTSFELAVRS
ncbi:MAG: YncE family protein [Propioniciclava sp.]|uniref:YncE family protein n=1 Tax=Propioniciclava sp. TaxID=2038686 RepID=UPI0039E5D0A9